jgi:hypothetical protein
MAWLYQANSSTKGIQMGNEEWCHRMQIGTNWTKLRIGVRIAVPAIQNFDGPVTGTFILGVTQGTQNVYKSPICTEFMGFVLGNAAVSNWVYGVNGNPYVTNTRPVVVSKLNGALTAHATGSASYYISAVNTVRTMAFVDITKTSATSYLIAPFAPGNTTQAVADNGMGNFIWSMESNTTPLNCSAASTGTISNWTGPGLMDSIYFGWERSVPPITLFDIAACRVL